MDNCPASNELLNCNTSNWKASDFHCFRKLFWRLVNKSCAQLSQDLVLIFNTYEHLQMKTKVKAALLTVGLLAGSISVANAADGTITFTGSVHSGACSIKPESVDQSVALGAIAKHQLQSGGKSTARPVTIELEGCDLSGLTDNTVTTTFTGAPSSVVPGGIGTVGSAGGIGIMMTHGGKAVELGVPTTPQAIVAGNNTLEFGAYVQGQATGDIVPGDFSAVTNFTLAYQ
jgi:type 1 fimbria pilin